MLFVCKELELKLGFSISMFDSKEIGATFDIGDVFCSRCFSNKWLYMLWGIFATETAFSGG